jgi:LacI family transcriptional regulator
MNARGLEIPSEDVLYWKLDQPELTRMIGQELRPTALIVFSERQAVTILREANSLGISVPDDLSVIGFDSTSFCDTTRPRLTAISQPIEQMAYDATNVLISTIEAEQSSSRLFIYPCGLDIRESTARPTSRC